MAKNSRKKFTRPGIASAKAPLAAAPIPSIWTTGRLQALICVITAAILATLLFAHANGINGPAYLRWPWIRLPFPRTFGWLLIGVLPFLAAQVVHYQNRQRRVDRVMAVVLLCFATLSLEISASGAQGGGVRRFTYLTEQPALTSYFTAAVQLDDFQRHTGASLREILADYPQFVSQFSLHARTKPPGPVLYNLACLRVFNDPHQAALAAGLGLGILASLVPCAVYALSRRCSRSRKAAFAAASFASLCPALILFFPEVDQAFPLFTCAIAGCWIAAVRSRKLLPAIFLGLLLGIACFFAYDFLILGAFMAAYALFVSVQIFRDRRRRRLPALFSSILFPAVVASLTGVSIYLVVYLCLGFNPLATLIAIIHQQEQLLIELPKPYPVTIFWDLLDFALGCAWIPILALAFYIGRGFRPRIRASVHHRQRWIAWLVLIQILAVAVSGLLPGETSRTWLFLMPLLALPVGFELADWRPGARMAFFAAEWVILAAICQNLALFV